MLIKREQKKKKQNETSATKYKTNSIKTLNYSNYGNYNYIPSLHAANDLRADLKSSPSCRPSSRAPLSLSPSPVVLRVAVFHTATPG